MSQYKLTYFNVRSRGEVARMLFSVAGVEFEDKRIPLGAPPPSQEWLDLKPQTPFGQLPVLEVNGLELSNSHAIERYLAGVFGLDGNSPWEVAQVDMWLDAINDIFEPLFPMVFEKDDTVKNQKKQKYKTETAPNILSKLDKALTNNKSGFLVGNSLTVADLSVLSYRDWLKAVLGKEGMALLTPFPKIQDHIKQISNVPTVAAWLRKRPITKF